MSSVCRGDLSDEHPRRFLRFQRRLIRRFLPLLDPDAILLRGSVSYSFVVKLPKERHALPLLPKLDCPPAGMLFV